DIEYKVTADDLLVIKQARPWVSFWADITSNNDLAVTAIVDPQSSSSLGSNELVTATIANTGLNDMTDFDIKLVVDGQLQETINVPGPLAPFSDADYQFTVPQNFSATGSYDVTCIVTDAEDEYGNNDTLTVVLSKVHLLDGEISVGNVAVACDNEVLVDAIITNHGETIITGVQIQVVVNGSVVDVINATVDVPFEGQETVSITVDDNLTLPTNNITLNLLSVNGQIDGEASNNSASTSTGLDSDYDIVTLVINADQYPAETSWEIIDEGTNQVVASGGVNGANQMFTEEICLNYSSCFTLKVYDSFGDGICCGFGQGDFQLLNASGALLVNNGGDFGHEAEEVFCPDGSGCGFTADVSVSHSTSVSADDGTITIYTNGGVGPFQYSIDGGQTFASSNSFSDLGPGTYPIYIEGGTGICSHTETVILEACALTAADIVHTDATSAVTTDGSIEITPTSGVAPYQYSIDGGQSFVSTGSFPNLPVGPYNVIVLDASGICPYEVVVPIEADGNVGIEDVDDAFSDGIWVYPNPTSNNINIEIESFSSEAVTIEVYDQLGRTIQTGSIAKDVSRKTTLSLDGYGAGSYFVKCYTPTSAKYFKVVKI
ncbi:MAG: T9SS type A sorting domain-containing protein, partial [Flavobacteriales bacterium]